MTTRSMAQTGRETTKASENIMAIGRSHLADAVEAVEQIIHDLRDRSGLGNEWDEIDGSTQDEIRKKWRDIILAEVTL